VLPWLVLIAAALSLAGFAHPWLDAAAAWPVWLFAALAVAANLAQRSILAARFAQSPLAVLLHPLGIIMMTAIQWHSWWLHITGRRAWKGRTGQAPPAATT
jgi:hypothetical protein